MVCKMVETHKNYVNGLHKCTQQRRRPVVICLNIDGTDHKIVSFVKYPIGYF